MQSHSIFSITNFPIISSMQLWWNGRHASFRRLWLSRASSSLVSCTKNRRPLWRLFYAPPKKEMTILTLIQFSHLVTIFNTVSFSKKSYPTKHRIRFFYHITILIIPNLNVSAKSMIDESCLWLGHIFSNNIYYLVVDKVFPLLVFCH